MGSDLSLKQTIQWDLTFPDTDNEVGSDLSDACDVATALPHSLPYPTLPHPTPSSPPDNQTPAWSRAWTRATRAASTAGTAFPSRLGRSPPVYAGTWLIYTYIHTLIFQKLGRLF